MAVLFMFLTVFVLILGIWFWNLRVESVAQENEFMQSYIHSLQSFYAMIQDQIEATRRYRHDLGKHIQTLELMLRQEDDSDIQEYLEGLKVQYHHMKREQYTSNEVLNTVISIKKTECQEKAIPFEFELGAAEYGVFSDMEIVGLFCNLLDNAIEASGRVAEGAPKGIWLKVAADEPPSGFTILIENYVSPDEPVRLETSKAEKAEHGVGMKIIDRIVSKYGGEKKIEIDTKANRFSVKIRIPEQRAV